MHSEILSLDGDWDLYFALEDGKNQPSPELLRRGGTHITAQVPGNVELDLHRAGLEPDPFYAENLYRFRKYEFYSWLFRRSFAAPAQNGSRWVLVFEGINTFAEIFLNGVRVGESDNFFIAHEFDVTGYLRWGEENILEVCIRSAVNEARRLDYPALVRQDEFAALRMPPHSFGWDIMGRFLSAGMWRPVRLEERTPTRLTDAYYSTMNIKPDGQAEMILRCRWETDAPVLDGFSLRVEGVCGNSRFRVERPTHFVSDTLEFSVPDARLWWPRGYGEQNLYQVRVTLLRDGVPVSRRTDRIGIRRFRVEHKMAPGDQGEFLVKVNGCPVLCKGTNWVCLDAFHSRDTQRLRTAHDLLDEVGCNMVRCWGGNVYEDHAFFDLCDERGILVWQDFAMACAMYSPAPEFTAKIEKEAAAVVKKLRNHPCILLWAGDNEVDEFLGYMNYPTQDACYNAITREVLPRVVRMHDPYRLFLPSSPYIDGGVPQYQVPEQHNWGARAWFKDDFYKHTTAHFISECGYHGCPAVSSLKRFIPEDQLSRWLDNPVWDTHSTDYLPFGPRYARIQLMHDQVDLLYGGVPEDLETFVRLSQISQAEAKKFFVERTRVKKWRRTGILWWNLLDGWPQISDAVVDYYYTKKLAFHYIKRVQKPIALIMDELQDWGHKLWLCNDSRTGEPVSWEVSDGDTGEILMSGKAFSPANENVCLGELRELAGRQKLYILRWDIGGKTHANHYISGYPSFDGARMLHWASVIAKLEEPFEWEV